MHMDDTFFQTTRISSIRFTLTILYNYLMAHFWSPALLIAPTLLYTSPIAIIILSFLLCLLIIVSLLLKLECKLHES